MSAASRLPGPPSEDDDLPAPGTPIQDPVLRKVKAGPDVEPAIDPENYAVPTVGEVVPKTAVK